jgi:uncharacterized flavoprotein (TIGR03862 family)
MTTKTHHVAVIGAGPAGLMAAQALARGGCRVSVIERMPSVARKFLMAGRGGLNLTHSEPLEAFIPRYGALSDRQLRAAILAFPPKIQIKWAEGLGQETFVGTSGRVFPKAMKGSPLLRAWLQKLETQNVLIRTRTTWLGWDLGGSLRLQADGAEAPTVEMFDAVVLALGGASWPRLGADGSWQGILAEAGVPITPLEPANAGIVVPWSDLVRTRHAGTPLKRVTLTVGNDSFKGEAMITRDGLEGGVIYAANEAIRSALVAGPAVITLDLRPETKPETLSARIAQSTSKKQSLANTLRKTIGLSAAAVSLLHESKVPLPRNAEALAARIKAVSLPVTGFAGMARAISTAGGVAFEGLDENWMLKQRPGVFVAGEMLDWTAPTGGYLLTACFATGRAAAEGCLAYLKPTAPA